MRICNIEGCNEKHKGHGYCDKHYQRFKRHGDVTVYFKKKPCKVEGCTAIYYGKGYCSKHYQRWIDHDDVNHVRGPKFKTPIEAYLNCVIKNGDDECWGWKGAKHDFGYGVIHYKKEQLTAHRFAYSHYVGEIPECVFVLHKCDNPECSNPKHLFLGTNLDNINDCIAKGRHPWQSHNRRKKHGDKVQNHRKSFN